MWRAAAPEPRPRPGAATGRRTPVGLLRRGPNPEGGQRLQAKGPGVWDCYGLAGRITAPKHAHPLPGTREWAPFPGKGESFGWEVTLDHPHGSNSSLEFLKKREKPFPGFGEVEGHAGQRGVRHTRAAGCEGEPTSQLCGQLLEAGKR